MNLPHDLLERTYAGVLGKLIGVYLGRPIEGWEYAQIVARFGQVRSYVHQDFNKPLVVSDDDISGTFCFLHALPEHGNSLEISSAQIGQTWLNQIIENRSILWWGGMGNSTEHTAYLRLKAGVLAPQSGSSALNSQVVAEQVGAQIFIDGWAMVAAGDPALAASLAERAARVSHDGEAVYAAKLLAVMEALAFVEPDIDTLLEAGLSFIPPDSVIARMIAELRGWHASGLDWCESRARLEAGYGYEKYGGNCHVVPNHGLIILGLLHGNGDFHKSMMIVNTCGWDTDCNAGNLGCLLGIRGGLAALEGGPDWRGPVADRLFLPGPEGGQAITDALSESYRIVNLARALRQLEPLAPKSGARYHYSLPGAVQGWRSDTPETLTLENQRGHSRAGQRSLAFKLHDLEPGRSAHASVQTFLPPEVPLEPPRGSPWKYRLLASPSLYSGQTLHAALEADAGNAAALLCRPYICVYNANDELERMVGPELELTPGAHQEFSWPVPDTQGLPIAEVGLEVQARQRGDARLYLDWLSWDGEPNLKLTRPDGEGLMWLRAWVDAADRVERRFPEAFRVIQNHGTGLLITGARDWRDYSVQAKLNPHLAASAGLGARVQGLRRYYALLLVHPGRLRLVKARDDLHTLAETPFEWEFGGHYDLRLELVGSHLRAWCDDQLVFDLEDNEQPLESGGVALLIEEGRLSTNLVTVRPASARGSPRSAKQKK